MDFRFIDICIFFCFLLIIYIFKESEIKNIKKREKEQEKVFNEITNLKLYIKKLEKTNHLFIEKIKILENKEIKLNSTIIELKDDIIIKNKLFLNSLILFKKDIENIFIKQNKKIEIIYYYLGKIKR
jgi:hypothetical protein